jgi:hypothetical protein
MSILRDFERRLEGTVEGTFGKLFRSEVQPVELAKRVMREMEDGRTVAPHGVWAPNRFVFTLSREDGDRFAKAEEPLARELRQVVRDTAKEKDWGLVGPPEIVLRSSRSMKKGEIRCEATLAEDSPELEADAAQAATAELVLAGRRFALTKDVTTIGRLDECDVVLTDPGASRRHAEVRRMGDGYEIVDSGSTNGTAVNDELVHEHALRPGDRITIGATVIEFRRA